MLLVLSVLSHILRFEVPYKFLKLVGQAGSTTKKPGKVADDHVLVQIRYPDILLVCCIKQTMIITSQVLELVDLLVS
eukprot:SAG31_NODE_64_length_28590_cov_17.914464_3_plen_77_part_00